jgi:hypothetical protein
MLERPLCQKRPFHIAHFEELDGGSINSDSYDRFAFVGNLEFRAITKSDLTRRSTVMMSSTTIGEILLLRVTVAAQSRPIALSVISLARSTTSAAISNEF